MSSQFVGQLMLCGFNFPPVQWATASGQLLSISQNTALFSLLGTQYGGDGRSTFALPNMQGNVAMSFGQGPGLSSYSQGETGGAQNITLLATEVPPHNHTLNTDGGRGTLSTPGGNSFVDGKEAPGSIYSATTTPAVNMSTSAVSLYGGSQPHNNLMPYLVLNWVIALQGIFPSRS
jgi:microcystin-dependent protein